MTFRLWLRSALLLAPAILLASAPQTLREAARPTGVLIGAAVRPSLFSEASYAATLAGEFNMVEPEDAMKWSTIRHDSATFDFREGDEVVRFAQAHDMKVRGHCLVWDHDNPDWLAQSHFTPAQLSHLLQEHITTVMKHYAGHVFAWDVVNEALDENGHLRDSPWFNQPGIGLADKGSAYIEQAFRWAHEADPQALLFYNDNGAEGLNTKSDAIYAMVKDFRHRGVPIDGVGLQMHISQLDLDSYGLRRKYRPPDRPRITSSHYGARRIAALGLERPARTIRSASPGRSLSRHRPRLLAK